MKKLFTFILSLLLPLSAFAGIIGETAKGTTDYSVELKIIDLTTGAPSTDIVYNSAGIDLWYRRQGAASVDITEATLADLTTAHADGGFLHINDGVYRLDLPDAAVASGADWVYVGGAVTGEIVIGGRVKLTNAAQAFPANFSSMAITGGGAVTAGTVSDKTGYSLTVTPPTAGTIADTVWDELMSGHTVSGSAGEALSNAGSAGDPWSTALPGSYTSGQAGSILSAIKGKTDSLTFTVAGQVDANAQYWNDTIISSALEDSGDVAAAVTSGLGTGSGFTALATAASITALNNLSAAEVNAQVDTALSDIYLDQLFANAYNSATPPGNAAAFFNELTENNAGVTRFTAGALAQAPSGTGASASSIYDYFVASNREDPFKADVGGLATATALSTHDGKLDTAQADLDTITGADGVTLASAQGNYAPATAAALTAHDGKLDTVDGIVDAIKAITDQINFGVSGQIDVNIESINTCGITGDGNASPWDSGC